MNNPVSGESSASGQGPHIAVGPAAVAIRRPELWNAWNLAGLGLAGRGGAGARQGIWQGSAGRGTAWRGNARHGRAWNMARLGMAGQGTSRLGLARLGKEYGAARLGTARPGPARQGTWAGVTTSKHKTHTEHGKNTTTPKTCTRKTTQSH